ncbi:MAG: four-carbon acid sugar kinase family protein [Verrucomicrobiales bacterium]|nr:four-carbon acid sugar kinase family protein [Verrucomicrobiales bacterium]
MSSLLLAFYGDDFTGSTDAMESLARAGLRTVLFLQAPTPAQLRRFRGLKAFGVAGTSRTMTPGEMARALPPVFRALRASGAPVVHYKICSTFDSSPQVGSIGLAIELAQRVFRSPYVPLLVGAPMLGRYCVFGNLFARSGLDSEPHRLDRHPTMRHHPTTPMDEADLRLHLARQTRKTVGLLDVVQLESPEGDRRLELLRQSGAEIILFDVLHERHLPRLGEWIGKDARSTQPIFAVGSSCVEYALVAWWRQRRGWCVRPPTCRLRPAPAIIVVSGSCSPVTDRQIEQAVAGGFAEVALNTAALAHPKTRAAAVASALKEAAPHFAAGRSVVFHTARGPSDPRLAQTSRVLQKLGLRPAATLGAALGRLLALALEQTGWRRGVVTGGDTSSFAARALGVEALEFAAPIAPGAPLCRVHAPGRAADGCEIVFKGGQNGRDNFLLTALHGDGQPGSNPH